MDQQRRRIEALQSDLKQYQSESRESDTIIRQLRSEKTRVELETRQKLTTLEDSLFEAVAELKAKKRYVFHFINLIPFVIKSFLQIV